ncbi:GGDEF domain-containing protein [Rhodospirillum rubrum]|uniref:Diguanylate cyclase (GGDEF domain) n=1 Tax=Rhodospirillum rubrum (strain ATCC 11170 / ATH 1.1.1 / DSM 467 / LMG 4362 / NCIMB 8255 / S1) TaxID=269796 RepID=Q2RRJ4_RHORT|nr:GGDEF domain-containing protein [Rhodospirillum rubrum]ABC23251.1 Putative diguanylate cyclase (GGDEF domain) [Rhodospirillum rubrum ATCC 11170]AEO48983.1 diguanylate cyclase [Rhodospirillum rubrum F11]MBK5954891.1 GGDEF domain-containing protein [Rhodospirillum rubrum]QXG79226.1 GGDEF domain-containing protein [Rhodospirillum rubrum]HCF18773.1 GGDEF domain-containing protein [Rhodospirillum rubrum]
MTPITKIVALFLTSAILWILITVPLWATAFPRSPLVIIGIAPGLIIAVAAAITIGWVLAKTDAAHNKIVAALEERAQRDPLTGMLNKEAFITHLEVAFARAQRSEKPFRVLFVDVDRFKDINDFHGHRFGDAALVAIAARLRSVLRSADIAARYGGDEFTIIVEPDEGDTLDAITARISRAFETPVDIDHNGLRESFPVTVSTGFSRYSDETTSVDALIEEADERMYDAKKRNRKTVSHPGAAGMTPRAFHGGRPVRSALMMASLLRQPCPGAATRPPSYSALDWSL